MIKLYVVLVVIVGLAIGTVFWLPAKPPEGQIASPVIAPYPPSATQPPTNEKSDHQSPDEQQAQADKSEIDLAVGNVVVPLLIDSSGRRTGRESSAKEPLQEIPNSTYFEDSVTNDRGGDSATEANHFIQIGQPPTGKYSITLTPLEAGDYQLSIRVFSSDGTSQPAILKTGHVEPGAPVKFELNYSSAPRATSSLN